MSADSRLLVQAVREGINREHLLLNDVDGQLGWSRDKTKNVFLWSNQTIRRRCAGHSQQSECADSGL